MESLLTDLRATAALIDRCKDKAVDLSEESDLTTALTGHLDYAAAAIRLAIGIAHRSENQRHWEVK
jgi:hypothetical protein